MENNGDFPVVIACVHFGLVAFIGIFLNSTCQVIDSLCNPCMFTGDDHKLLQVGREFRIAKNIGPFCKSRGRFEPVRCNV